MKKTDTKKELQKKLEKNQIYSLYELSEAGFVYLVPCRVNWTYTKKEALKNLSYIKKQEKNTYGKFIRTYEIRKERKS